MDTETNTNPSANTILTNYTNDTSNNTQHMNVIIAPVYEKPDPEKEKERCRELETLNYNNERLKKRNNVKTDRFKQMVVNSTQKEVDELLKNKIYNIDKSGRGKDIKWTDLTKCEKEDKLFFYCEKMVDEEVITLDRRHELYIYLSNALDNNKLLKQKDVVYDLKTERITLIPNLMIHPTRKTFTLRKEKKESTLKNLTVTRKQKKKIKKSKNKA